MENKTLTVLWISAKNGNGICIDGIGNEYYVDSSIGGFEFLNRKDTFNAKTDRISGVQCVRDIGDIKLNIISIMSLK